MRFPDEGSGVTPVIVDQHPGPERRLQPVNRTGDRLGALRSGIGSCLAPEAAGFPSRSFTKLPHGPLPGWRAPGEARTPHPSGSAAGRKHFSPSREPRRPTWRTTTPACDRLMTGCVYLRCRFGSAHAGLRPSWITRTWSTNAVIASSVASASSSCGECPAPASIATSTGQVASSSAAWTCTIVHMDPQNAG
jgi:hypothetical protein